MSSQHDKEHLYLHNKQVHLLIGCHVSPLHKTGSVQGFTTRCRGFTTLYSLMSQLK